MSYIKKSGGTVAIQIDTDYLARQLHKYSLAALVNSFGEDGGEIDCSFGFDYMPNGQDLFTLTATVIEPVGSSLVIGADDKVSADDAHQTGIFFLLRRDDEGDWVVGDSYYTFDQDEITKTDDATIAQIFLDLC